VARALDARHRRWADLPEPRADYGAVLNYSLFGATGALSDRDFGRLDTFSGSFDLRVFGPLGTLSHSFIAGRTSDDWMEDVVRLRTAWVYSDPHWMLTYRAGDLISGGLSWERSVNLGVQAQRNFGLRRDLVTKPLPSFAGSAAVPSTIEVSTSRPMSAFPGAVSELSLRTTTTVRSPF
jgi:outer membrane usher protein